MGNKILKKIDKILYYTKDTVHCSIQYTCQFSSNELFSWRTIVSNFVNWKNFANFFKRIEMEQNKILNKLVKILYHVLNNVVIF